MKKIIILHVPNTLNYGSAMMGINFIYYFSHIINEDLVYVTQLFTEGDLNRLNYETLNQSIIEKFNLHSSVNVTTKNEKIIKFIKMIIYSIKDILAFDPIAIIILGGDDISEYYSIIGLLYSFYSLHKLSQKSNVFLISQTIGPFYSWRKKLAGYCLKYCHIFTRDPLSANYIRNTLELKNIIESSDLAFLDLPNQNNLNMTKKLLEKYGIISNKYITLIPSGLNNHYTNNFKDYIKGWVNIIYSLSNHSFLKSNKIVILAHVLRPEKVDDRKIINKIRKELPDEISNRMVYITDVLLPTEARIILGNGIFTITGRMHGAISTFQMLKPALSLSYGVKYKGVIGQNLGMNDLIIEAKSDVLWSSGEITELVMEKVEYIFGNYDEITSRIIPAVNKNKKMAIAQIECVAKKLKGLVK